MTLIDDLHEMCGVWHDHVQGYYPDGTVMTYDEHGGTPGAFPYENLVYIDFDGTSYRQTNVTVQGRPLHVRGFVGEVRDGVLRFGQLGPHDPGHLGVSAGPGCIVFLPARLDDPAVRRFADPDYIRLLGADQRTRTTTLYRYGELVRTLRVSGTRITTATDRRVDSDPRGVAGPVHGDVSVTKVYEEQPA